MDQGLRVSLLKVWNKEGEFFNGVMEKSMMGNGKAVARTAVECGKELMDNLILENGKMARLKVLAFMSWKMDLDMKDSSKIHWNMELELKGSIMEKLMLVIIKRTDRMGRVSTIGPMETIIKVHFQMDWGTVMATLNKEKLPYNIEDNIRMIKNVDMVK